jgi:hypothetical protein
MTDCGKGATPPTRGCSTEDIRFFDIQNGTCGPFVFQAYTGSSVQWWQEKEQSRRSCKVHRQTDRRTDPEKLERANLGLRALTLDPNHWIFPIGGCAVEFRGRVQSLGCQGSRLGLGRVRVRTLNNNRQTDPCPNRHRRPPTYGLHILQCGRNSTHPMLRSTQMGA